MNVLDIHGNGLMPSAWEKLFGKSSKSKINKKRVVTTPDFMVTDHGSKYIVDLILTGHTEDDFIINVDNYWLEISLKSTNKTFTLAGPISFYKKIKLPEEILTSNYKTKYTNGILTIKLKKALKSDPFEN